MGFPQPATPRRSLTSRFRSGSWLLIGLLATSFSAHSSAFAATFYVDNTNSSASDTGPGSTTTPYRTITAAVNLRGAAGNTVRVLAGTYREQVTVPVSGSAGLPFILEAASSAVTVDGADLLSTSQWTLVSGSVWLASSVTWAPRQVFADGARLAPSGVAPASMPSRTFQYIAGAGLYVNAGGGNPATHGTLVGHRLNGIVVNGKSYVSIRGFTVLRADDKGITFGTGTTQSDILDNRSRFHGAFGIQLTGCTSVRVARNVTTDNGNHGMSLTAGSTNCTIEDNESANNVFAASRQANGLDLFGSSFNLIQRNRFHHNQDTGLNIRQGSNDNHCLQNLSYANGDHGFDNLLSTGLVHIGEVAFGNVNDGISLEGTASGARVFDCILMNNGIGTGRFDLFIDATSVPGSLSNDNVIFNTNGQTPVRFGVTEYPTVAAYATATGQDTRSLAVDPLFVNAANGDFHLRPGSRAIDSGNSSVAGWPATDFEGRARFDDPATTNTGIGPVPFTDRGALEFTSTTGPRAPIAMLNVTPSSGVAPLSVLASGVGSRDPDGNIMTYRFDFGDGTVVGPQTALTANHTFAAGNWTVTLTVTDNSGMTGTASLPVSVGISGVDHPPVLTAPASVSVLENSTLTVNVSALDPDGQPITSLTADLSRLPSGNNARFTVSDNDSLGRLRWTPTYNDSGVYVVSFRAVANGLATTVTTRIHVINVDRAPIVTAPNNLKVTAGTPVSLTVNAIDPDGDPIASLTVAVTALDVGTDAVFVVNATHTTGTYRWTPRLNGNKKNGKLTFTARNALEGSAKTNVHIGQWGPKGAAEPQPLPLALSTPWPNPAAGAVSFHLDLPQESDVEWAVFDVQGRSVWSERATFDAGRTQLRWDGLTTSGARAGSGVYLVRVHAGGEWFTRRVMRL